MPPLSRRAVPALLLAALALLALAPAGRAAARVVETVIAPHFSASLSWNAAKGTPWATGLHLRVRRAHKVVLDHDYPYETVPARDLPHRKSIRLRDIDGDGAQEVVADLFTGGAHCCFKTDVIDQRKGAYRRVSWNWRDAGYNLRDLDGDGRPEFVSADARFAKAFAPYAFSGFPTRVVAFRGGRFHVVTGDFPAQVRKNAHLWYDKALAAGAGTPVRGYLAAYAADKSVLGEGADALAKIRAMKRGGNHFADRLESFLVGLGYPPATVASTAP